MAEPITCYSPRPGVLCYYAPDSDRTAVIARRDDPFPARPASYELLRSDGPACAGELPLWWCERRAIAWVSGGREEAR